MLEVIFLIVLALIWIIFAVVQDLRQREIADWLSFSLIIFALGFRFFYSLFEEGSFHFFYQGLIGFGIFFVLGNLLYYSRVFGGGDAKLMYSLGAILSFSSSFFVNLDIFILFLLLFLFAGAFYGLTFIIFLIIKNFHIFKLEFLKKFKSNRHLVLFVEFIGIVFLVLGYLNESFLFFGVFIFILPYLYLSAKAIDDSCMVKKIPPKRLTEGDLLYEDVKIGKRTIKKSWGGLLKKDIKLLRHKEFVLIRQGIPFSPTFLIAFLILIFLWFSGLWNSFW